MAKLTQWIKGLALWLESRFPVQCVVAKADYDALVASFNATKLDNQRLDAVVADLKMIAAVVDVMKSNLESLVKKQELMERRPGTPDMFTR